jgi:hypothetical protein
LWLKFFAMEGRFPGMQGHDRMVRLIMRTPPGARMR